MEIQFQFFELEGEVNGECVDYVLISTLDKICEIETGAYVVELSDSSHIDFKFVTNSKTGKEGFWLRYKGS